MKHSFFNILFILFISLLSCLSQELKMLKQHISTKNIFNKFKYSSSMGGISFGSENEMISQIRFHFEISFNLSHCFFTRSTLYTGSGGIIFVSGGSYSMNISSSMFYNCSCTSEGGSIYFNSFNSNLRMICANRCSCGATTSGNFAWIQASQVNQAELISVCFCSHAQSGYQPIRLGYGNQKFDSTNCSMNYATRISGISLCYSSSFTSSFCTFSNNRVSEYICIVLYSQSGTMSYSNIVHNNSPSSNYGVIRVYDGSPKMMYCIFDNNQNTLFCVETGSLEVSHSYISYSALLSTSTPVSISNNNSLSKRETYHLQFFNSLYCNADDPIIIYTPAITFHQSSLKSVLFFNPLILFFQ